MADGVQIVPLPVPTKGIVKASAIGEVPQGALYDGINVVPFDCQTGRKRLSVRPGFSAFGSSSNIAGFAILGDAFNETGGIQLFYMTSTTLYKWTGAAWSSVGTFTTSSSRTIHAASKGKQLFIACNDPYKYYDYDPNDDGNPVDAGLVSNSWNTDVTAGTIPPNCRIVAKYGERMVLLADPSNPHVVNFSRDDDPFDWDFTQEDDGTAVALEVTEAVTAAFQHNRNCFVICSKNGMWVLRGNPAAANAVLEQFEFSVGPINSSAWCKGDNGFTYLLTHNGLYKMPPGCGDPPVAVSRDILPADLIGLDGTNSKAYLAYDERWRLVHIYIEGTHAAGWLYDVDTGSFWKTDSPGSTILATIRWGLGDSDTASGTLIGTASGAMRLDNAESLAGGDTAAFAQWVFQIAPAGMKSIATKMTTIFTSESDDNCLVGLTGLANSLSTLNANPRFSGARRTDLANNNGVWFPRVGGQYLGVEILQDSQSDYWSLESAAIYLLPAGTERSN